jgi:hypothetical protein
MSCHCSGGEEPMRIISSFGILSAAASIGCAILFVSPSLGQAPQQDPLATALPRITSPLRATVDPPCRGLFKKPGKPVEVRCSARGKEGPDAKFDLETLSCTDPSLEPLMAACLPAFEVRKGAPGPFCVTIIYDDAAMASSLPPLPPGANIVASHSVGVRNMTCPAAASGG